MMSYQDSLIVLRAHDAELASKIVGLPNLEAVLRWAPKLQGVDSIQQDEYNYDILIPHAEAQWLVFGVT